MAGTAKRLLSDSFDLAHVATSKALAVCDHSIFESSPWTVSTLNFTTDTTPIWRIREMVLRCIQQTYAEATNERDRLITVTVGADKAYSSATQWDLAGYPLTCSAAKREVEYLTKVTPATTGMVEVKVAQWPRTAMLRAKAEQLLQLPAAAAAGVIREPWMTDVVESLSRERWRDWLLAQGIVKLKVKIVGIDEYMRRGLIPPSAEARAPLSGVKVDVVRQLARKHGIWDGTEKVLKTQLQARLKAIGVTHGVVRLSDLSLPQQRRQPVVRSAVHQLMDEAYRAAGRDFDAAFSYPEDLPMSDGQTRPLLIVWDDAHGMKNARMAEAHAVTRAAAAPTPARPTEVADALEEREEDAVLFDEDDSLGRVTAVREEELVGSVGSMAYKVGMAALAVIEQPDQQLIHKRSMDPKFEPQHVPTAIAVHSHATAARMRQLHHVEAADFDHMLASQHESIDRRGFSATARWAVWNNTTLVIRGLDPSLQWNPTSLSWHSPRSTSIEGYSRVLLESYLVMCDSCRALDIMVGRHGCRYTYDRRKGSDLCEALFARCVEVMRQDKVSKRCWLRFFAKIVRQSRRKLMDKAERRTPIFSEQHKVYQDGIFVPGFRSCLCQPPCQIGGQKCSTCICAQENSRAASRTKLLSRDAIHAEASTRNKFNVNNKGGSVAGCSPVTVIGNAAGNGQTLPPAQETRQETHQVAVAVGCTAVAAVDAIGAERDVQIADSAVALDIDLGEVDEGEDEEGEEGIDPAMDF